MPLFCVLNECGTKTECYDTMGGGLCLAARLYEYALTVDCHTLITNWTSIYRTVSDTKFRYQLCCVIFNCILSEVRNTHASRSGKQNELFMHLFWPSLYPFLAAALASDVPCIIRLLCWQSSFHLTISFLSAPLCKHMTSLELNRTAYIDAFLPVQ
jgi:hypothetical protein